MYISAHVCTYVCTVPLKDNITLTCFQLNEYCFVSIKLLVVDCMNSNTHTPYTQQSHRNWSGQSDHGLTSFGSTIFKKVVTMN